MVGIRDCKDVLYAFASINVARAELAINTLEVPARKPKQGQTEGSAAKSPRDFGAADREHG